MSEINNIRNQYIADGIIENFFFDFNIFEEKNLEVYLNSNKQSLGFTILNFGEEGGEIKFNIAPENNTVVTLVRNVEIKRTTDFQEGGAFRASVINNEFDYQVACMKQLKNESDRSMLLPPYAKNVDLSLPDPEAGKAIIWNKNCDGLSNSSIDIGVLNSSLDIAIKASEELSEARDIALDAVDKIKFAATPKAGSYLRRNLDNTSYENVSSWDLFPIMYQTINSVLKTIPENWEVQYGQLANKTDYQELYNKLEAENLLIPDYQWLYQGKNNKFSDGKSFDYTYSYLPQLNSDNDKGYLIEASSEPYDYRNKSNAFNYMNSTESDNWQSLTGILPAWLSIKCPNYRKVTSYAIKTDLSSTFPVDWEFRGYRVDGSYEILDSQTGHTAKDYFLKTIDCNEIFDKFRIHITKFNSTSNLVRLSLEIYGQEIIVGKKNIIPTLFSANQDGYIVTTSDENPDVNLNGYRAFDDKSLHGTSWQTENSVQAWLAVELPEEKTVSSYKIFQRNYTVGSNFIGFERTPISWDLLGSNNGSDWDVIDSRYSVVWEKFVPQIFDISSPISYKHYKIDIKDNNGSSVVAIGRLELFEDVLLDDKFRFPDLRTENKSVFPMIKVKD